MTYEVEYIKAPLGWMMLAPKGVSKAPGVVLLHGSGGRFSGWIYLEAYDLASSGFVAMPFGYSKGGDAWFSGDIHDVELFETVLALRALRNHENVDGKVGLYGVSRGAEHALLLTSLMVDDPETIADIPDAVAVHAPSDFIVRAFIADRFHPKINEVDDGRLAWKWRGSSEGLTEDTLIQIERYSGPIQISHGEDDELWEVDRTRRLEARLVSAGRSPKVDYYPKQGHGFYGQDINIARSRLKEFFHTHLGEPTV